MKRFVVGVAVLTSVSFALPATASARTVHLQTAYDGPWRLAFVTSSGVCAPSYEFDVNISKGVISHPNLVRFHGSVSPGGAARASVAVQDKLASGSGRLSMTSGKGSWRGYSGSDRCSGYWTAQKI